ncbi:MAG: FtsX-like permease family protein [Oscillospiraceae bacterium]|nr:FtsX-like permease family protein [Oscillospiraceae bacterium]
MSLTAKLALQQLKNNRRSTIWSLFGIILSVAMLTAVGGYGMGGAAILNDMLTNLYGEGTGANYEHASHVFSALIGGIVVITAIIVISNAFRVSASERTHQFGVMKSVGATKKQIRSTVMYEGIFLSIIGLPLGFVTGLLFQWLAIMITNIIMGGINYTMGFSVSPILIISMMVLSFCMVLLSAWLPAAKAAKIPAISAIRGIGEVKLRKEKPKKSRFIGKIFGFEGQLAAKQLKRSRRNFRATVISISVCIVLVLASVSINSHMFAFLDGRLEQLGDMRYSIFFSTANPDAAALTVEIAENITHKLKEFPGAEVDAHGSMLYSLAPELSVMSREDLVSLVVLEQEMYNRLINEIGAAYGSNILINVAHEIDSEGNMSQYNPYNGMVGQTLSLYPVETIIDEGGNVSPALGKVSEVEITAQITELPDDSFIKTAYAMFTNTKAIIVPELNFDGYSWIIFVDDITGFETYAQSVFDEHLTLRENETLHFMDIAEELIITTAVINFFSTFISIFSIMLALLGLTNVISTITTNIQLRAKEFAVLSSVGMTKGGMRRMLALESLLGSIRALIFGLPLGIFMAWLVYQGIIGVFGQFFNLPFIMPWRASAVCAFGVLAVTFAIMRFAAVSLNKGSIIETIRSGRIN